MPCVLVPVLLAIKLGLRYHMCNVHFKFQEDQMKTVFTFMCGGQCGDDTTGRMCVRHLGPRSQTVVTGEQIHVLKYRRLSTTLSTGARSHARERGVSSSGTGACSFWKPVKAC